MSEPLTIRKAIDKLIDGTIRIPGFQRPFVWEPARAALLMDSLYKGYPVGTVLLWRTRHRLKTERRLGVFELPPPDADYPVDYVLDGQQRLTSIFSTFQTTLTATEQDTGVWLPIYYDFLAEEDAQDSRFVALTHAEADAAQYFPLAVFLEPLAFTKATGGLSEARLEEIVGVHQKFVETLVPVQTFESEDRTRVAIVFERVNRMGIELDVFQLLTAWTWSDEFDLQQQFQALAEEFEDFGFEDVGDDTDLMLRCAAAVLQRDPSPAALVNVNGAEVRAAFGNVAEAIRLAIDFVRANFQVHHVRLLPYSACLIPLAAFFSIRSNEAITDAERAMLTRWFWRSCFSHRYSGNPQRNIREDIQEAVKLREGKVSSIDDVPFMVGAEFFERRFSIRTVATKAFILLLAQQNPRSFLSGQPIKVDRVLAEPNRSEYHHCYPKAKLMKAARPSGSSDAYINALANFAIISRAENRKISDKLPSEYRTLMPDDAAAILASAVIPDSLFRDDYPTFIRDRVGALLERLSDLVDMQLISYSDGTPAFVADFEVNEEA